MISIMFLESNGSCGTENFCDFFAIITQGACQRCFFEVGVFEIDISAGVNQHAHDFGLSRSSCHMQHGGAIQLKFLLENLMNEALTYASDGRLELHIYKEGSFVRFDFIGRRREYTQEELNQLFYPHLSRMGNGAEGKLEGTEYLVCKQIIRDHDEFSGRRGCRMNASRMSDGGFMVWFTLPVR